MCLPSFEFDYIEVTIAVETKKIEDATSFSIHLPTNHKKVVREHADI